MATLGLGVRVNGQLWASRESELVCEGPVSVEAPAATLGGERPGTEEGVLRDRSK